MVRGGHLYFFIFFVNHKIDTRAAWFGGRGHLHWQKVYDRALYFQVIFFLCDPFAKVI